MSLSIDGDGFYQVALAWLVYEIWDSPAAFVIVDAAVTPPNFLPALLTRVC